MFPVFFFGSDLNRHSCFIFDVPMVSPALVSHFFAWITYPGLRTSPRIFCVTSLRFVELWTFFLRVAVLVLRTLH